MGVSNGQLLWAILRSRKARGLNREVVGQQFSERLGVVQLADLKAYAAATNDPNPLYDEGLIPPLFMARLIHPLLLKLLTHREANLNLLRMVHGQQVIRFMDWVQVGDELDASMTITEILDTPAGELMNVDFGITRAGDLMGEARVGLLVRGGGGGGKKEAKPAAAKPEPAFTREMPTAPDQALRYADASGDHNFIHKSNLMAKMAGLPRTILHGMCTLAMATGNLASELVAGDVRRLAEVDARFAAMTYPGDTLTLVGYPEQNGAIPFEVQNAKGKAVLKNGTIKLKD